MGNLSLTLLYHSKICLVFVLIFKNILSIEIIFISLYKVFISSTMADLQKERNIIEECIKKHNGMPIRAEQFFDSYNSAEKVIEKK